MNDDLISRRALKDEIKKELDKADLSEYEACICVTSIYDRLIDNAPTVEQSYQAPKDYIRNKLDYSRPQGKWIPVSERLPEEGKMVLVWFEYYRYGDYNCMYQTHGFCRQFDERWSRFINGETGWKDARIIAWMPLPLPYEEAENE